MYEVSTFDNGLRLVTVSMPHGYSVSMGIYLAVGSRYETAPRAGASHFVEHMLFKGTERRPTPREIAYAVESVGGDINASTGREMTTYYARVSRDHLSIAADVLVDMLCNSQFKEEDVERERQVIIEEINESLDLPDDLAFMQFNALLWPDHPLAHDVAGTRESVRALNRGALLDYMNGGYVPERTVISVAGPVSHLQVRDLLGPMLRQWRGRDGISSPPTGPVHGPVAQVHYRPGEQSHLVIGTRGPSRVDEDRFAFSLMNIILGDGMSSRLFNVIREELGLAYSVYSFTSNLSDTGNFGVYAAVDSDNLRATIEAILTQLRRLREEPVTEEELAMTKAYARGRTLLRLEDSGANAGWVGSQLVMVDQILTPEEVLERLDSVTIEEIQAVSRRYLRDDALVMSIVGPANEGEAWETMLRVE